MHPASFICAQVLTLKFFLFLKIYHFIVLNNYYKIKSIYNNSATPRYNSNIYKYNHMILSQCKKAREYYDKTMKLY